VINSEIKISQVSLSQTPKPHNADSPAKRSNGSKNISVRENDQLTKINSLYSIKSGLNTIAKNIRAADKTIKAIANYIDKMKAELGRTIKNYPPFPPGSEERAKLLKSYISLRKQIDQLTIPPPKNEFSIEIVIDSEVVPETGVWDILTDFNSVHIPDLSEDATDEDIAISIEKFKTAKEKILQIREELARETKRISSQEKNAPFSKLFPGYGDELAEPEPKSLEMGNRLSEESRITLSLARSELLSLLEQTA